MRTKSLCKWNKKKTVEPLTAVYSINTRFIFNIHKSTEATS